MASDLVERLLKWAYSSDMGRKPDPTDMRREAADKIEALIAAGDKLAGYAEHVLDCNDNYRPRKPCDCGYTEAWKAWDEARGGDNAELR